MKYSVPVIFPSKGAMLNGKRIVVVMPAYNAGMTLKRTFDDIPKDIVDDILLTDDKSGDNTVELARSLGIKVFTHDRNLGYGGNQKTCYKEAIKAGADVVIMLHPDYQYPPKLITPMAALITSGMFDVVLGSRILGNKAIKGGMPVYKYIANRVLTFIENIMLGEKLSEYHTGFRAFSRQVLLDLPILEDSDDFVFDNQILAQTFYFGYRVGEITCPARYEKDSSSINPYRSIVYGLGVLKTAILYRFERLGFSKSRFFSANGKKLSA